MDTSETAIPTGPSRPFWLAKLFSLLGIVPLGIYVVIHLYKNMYSLSGEAAFNHYLEEGHSTPLIVPVAVLVLWIPILFHGIYGLWGLRKSKPNLYRFRYFENLKYVLQRLSGLGLLLFIPAHIYKTRIEPGFLNSHLNYNHMVEGLHEPVTLVVYLLGVLGVAFHLANGLWQFAIGWGLTTSEVGMRRIQRFSILFFLILLAMGYLSIWGFYKV